MHGIVQWSYLLTIVQRLVTHIHIHPNNDIRVCLCLLRIRSSDARHCPMVIPFYYCAKVSHTHTHTHSNNNIYFLSNMLLLVLIDFIYICLIIDFFLGIIFTVLVFLLLCCAMRRVSGLSCEVLRVAEIKMSPAHRTTQFHYW